MLPLIAVLLFIIAAVLLYMTRLIKTNEQKATNDSAVTATSDKSDSKLDKEQTPKENTKPSSNNNGKSKINKKYRKTNKMKWRDKMLDISMIPQTVELDKNTLLPKSVNCQYGYGKRFNSFISETGDGYFHRSTCSKVQSGQKQLVHRYVAACKITSCPICTPNTKIDDWYIEFCKVNFNKFTTYADFQSQLELSGAKFENTNLKHTIEEKHLSPFNNTTMNGRK